MERKLTDFLKEPLSGGRLKLIPSLLIFIVSVFVNAYFLQKPSTYLDYPFEPMTPVVKVGVPQSRMP